MVSLRATFDTTQFFGEEEAPQPPFLDLRCMYMEVVHDPTKLMGRFNHFVPESLEYDTLVGTGLSGTLAVAELARKLNKHYLVVRKDNDGTHSSLPVEGFLGKRWLFVDDVVDSGRTFARVWEKVQTITYHYEFQSEFAGTFLYGDRQYIRPDQCHHRWLQAHADTYRGQLAGREGNKMSFEIN